MPDRPDEESTEPTEFEHYGLIVTAEPGWDATELDGYVGVEDRPLVLAKDEGLGFVQFSVQTSDQKSRIAAGALRHWLRDMIKETGMGPGSDLVELKTRDALILACSFRPEDVFHRLWYWSDRKRLVLVTYTAKGDPDPDELRECAAMVARLRMNRRPRAGNAGP